MTDGAGEAPPLFRHSMNYSLPTTAEIGGREVPIRTDFRVILDILECLNDPELGEEDKGQCVLEIFYPEPPAPGDREEALQACFRFIDGAGEPREQRRKQPRLMDWAYDFERIVAPVNRVLGYEIRAVPYDAQTNTGGLHWWTFQAAYMEIGGESTISQVIGIRDKLARGKKLEKHEREWYSRNRELVDLPVRLTEAEDAILKDWT